MTQPSLDFFYEFASPYACLSALRIRALGQAAKVSIRWPWRVSASATAM